MKTIQEVVNDPEWQALRLSLLRRWRNFPTECLEDLRQYGGDLSDPDKVRRLLNYLTGSGFRTGKINSPAIEAYRETVREAWGTIKGS
jgi:hypothetical protein